MQLTVSLEQAQEYLKEAKVPAIWMGKSYPSKKSLGGYVNDLKLRISFFEKWIQQGTPLVFWISGFYFTQSFLTGVLQNYARKQKIPIDEIAYQFEVPPFLTTSSSATSRPKASQTTAPTSTASTSKGASGATSSPSSRRATPRYSPSFLIITPLQGLIR